MVRELDRNELEYGINLAWRVVFLEFEAPDYS